MNSTYNISPWFFRGVPYETKEDRDLAIYTSWIEADGWNGNLLVRDWLERKTDEQLALDCMASYFEYHSDFVDAARVYRQKFYTNPEKWDI